MSTSAAPADPVLDLRDVSLTRDGRRLLNDVTWRVGPTDRWVVLGPNGSGKSTLLRIASLWLHPTSGTVRVLGEELGRTDVRTLRTRIGVVSAALADQLRQALTAHDLVMTAINGALEPWWHTYYDSDRERARLALDRVGAADLAGRTFGTLSSGERWRAWA